MGRGQYSIFEISNIQLDSEAVRKKNNTNTLSLEMLWGEEGKYFATAVGLDMQLIPIGNRFHNFFQYYVNIHLLFICT